MRECRQCGWKGEGTRCPVDGLLTVDPLELTEPDDPNSLIGQVIGDKYLVESRLGKGGMGTVWRARHRLLNHGGALKVIDPAVADPQQASQRFYTEALSCSRLSHPNTIRIFDFGILPQGSFYMVMELLRGHDLQAELNHHGALYPLRAVRIARQVCKSLSEAHAAGVIHRDLKPSNVFLAEVHGEPDLVKVIDFGIAKLFAVESSAALTGTGTYLGTPRYMSPEQASASRVDLRTDLYSLGVVLYEMLVGTIPFEASAPTALLLAHTIQAPRPLPETLAGVVPPPAMRELVAGLLAKDPTERPASADEVALRLATVEADLLASGCTDALARDESRQRAALAEARDETSLPAPPPVRLPPAGPAGGAPGDLPAGVLVDRGPPAGPADSRELRPRSGRGWLVVGALLFVVAFGAGGLGLGLLLRGQQAPTAPGAVPAPGPAARAASGEAAPTPSPDGTPPPAVAAAALGTGPARVQVTSVPAGARIEEDGRLLGVTPLELPPGAEHRSLVLSLPGYHAATVIVDGRGGGPRAVVLEPLTPPSGPHPGRSGRPAGRPGAQARDQPAGEIQVDYGL